MPVLRSGRLTWSQQEWVQWVPSDSATSFEDNICESVPVDGVPRRHVLAAVRDVVRRHEGLRSLVRRGPGESGSQHVCPVDAGLDTIVEFTDADPSRPHGRGPWRLTCFRVGEQWPAAFVLFAAGDEVRRIDIVIDHVAVDPWGMRVLREDLEHAIGARAAGAEPFPGDRPVEQPIDAAEAEVSPAGLAYQRRAARHWERRLSRMAESLDGHVPRAPAP
ncbi:hypothetical protein, partial [Nonomuraea antimicrobica]|uniref:hypothetical protein n=1 Tax=Nonomuraea antimicrobica TaxID=561173 RepID=UPI0031ECC671